MNSIDTVCEQIVEGAFEALWSAMPDEHLLKAVNSMSSKSELAYAYTLVMKKLAREALTEPSPWKVTREDIGIILDYHCGNIPQAPTKLSRLLAYHGIKNKVLRKGSWRGRGVDVYWKIDAALRKDLEEVLDGKHLRAVK